MKRRQFFNFNQNENLTDDFSEPVFPTGFPNKFAGKLNRRQAAHLLRRVGFAPNADDISAFVGLTADEAFDKAVASNLFNLPLPNSNLQSWLDTAEYNPLDQITDIRFEIEGRLKSRYVALIDWWLELMRTDSLPALEKFTLFLSQIWSVEFTYDTEALIPPSLLYMNNYILRVNRLGNYKNIAKEITLDGSMMLYQSLHYSSKEAPNENYMRELLELFTMGIGNYTEGDIRAGAKVLTGWRSAAYFGEPKPNGNFKSYFSPNDHDLGEKTIFGRTISARSISDNTEFQVKEQEVYGLIDILFEEKASAVGRFVAEKIYKYFVYSSPGAVDYDLVAKLGVLLTENDFELLPVYKALFTSSYFFDDYVIGSQIKTPPEYVVGLQRQLGVRWDDSGSGKTRKAVFELEQELYDPPNVGSWTGYRTWLSTKTYPARIRAAKDIIEFATNDQLISLAKKLPNFTDAELLCASFAEYMLPVTISSDRLADFKLILLNSAIDQDWPGMINSNSSEAADGIRSLITEIILSPDYQLS